jgi:hypothetical protein
MKAGEIEISVIANYAALDGQLADVVSKSQAHGDAAGDKFGKGFEGHARRYIDQAANDMGMKLTKAAGALSIANALNGVLRTVADGGTWAEGITQALERIPVVGIFYGIGKSIGDIISDEAGKALAELDMEAEQRAQKLRLKFLGERLDRPEQLQASLTSARERDEIDRLRAEGNVVEAINREAEAKKRAAAEKLEGDLAAMRAAQERELAELGDRQNQKEARERFKAEEAAIRELAKLEAASIERTRRTASEKEAAAYQKRFDDEVAKRKEADDKAAAQAQADILDEIELMNSLAESVGEEMAKNVSKALEDSAAQIEGLENQRMAIAQETGTMQTSFGTFKFSAYSDAEKKQVDSQLLREVQLIRSKANEMATQGGPI